VRGGTGERRKAKSNHCEKYRQPLHNEKRKREEKSSKIKATKGR